MSQVFLRARWLNLIIVNYEIDATVLKPHVPAYTELDFYNGTCYASLVGFLFKDTKLKGIPVPFHRTLKKSTYVSTYDRKKITNGNVELFF